MRYANQSAGVEIRGGNRLRGRIRSGRVRIVSILRNGSLVSDGNGGSLITRQIVEEIRIPGRCSFARLEGIFTRRAFVPQKKSGINRSDCSTSGA